MKPVTISVIALCILMVACGGSGASATIPTLSVGDSSGAPATTAARSSEGGGDESVVGVPPVDNRQVIYDGSIHLQAANT